jgi:hypothetical protein
MTELPQLLNNIIGQNKLPPVSYEGGIKEQNKEKGRNEERIRGQQKSKSRFVFTR